MKKILVIFLSILAFLTSVYFAFNIFLKIYFNEFYYYTPDFKGLTLEETKQMDKNKVFDIQVAGEEFSSYPQGEIFMQEPTSSKVVKKGRNIKVWVSKGSDEISVPDLVGKNLIDITGLLQKDGLTIKKISYIISPLPYNAIIATNPSANSRVKRGDKISILVSDVDDSKEVSMPDLVGLDLDEAKKLLNNNSLTLGNITYQKADYLDSNVVIDSSIGARSKIKAGTAVDLIVSQ